MGYYNLQKEPAWKLIIADLLIICTILGLFAYLYLFRPEVVVTVSPTDIAPEPRVITGSGEVSEADIPAVGIFENSVFTQETVRTENSYISADVAVTVTDSTTTNTNGTNVVYHLADIYVRDITSLRTVFAQDKYGKFLHEDTMHIAKRTGAVCSINGDYYGTAKKNQIIRNGKIYGETPKSDDVCILYRDGTMAVYATDSVDLEKELDKDAWQAWSFGPGLLNKDGSPIEVFDSPVKGNHPRSVVAYYEPGHYAFLAVDGRSNRSAGLTLKELSALCGELGFKCAYNLDGGQTTVMTFMDEIANKPYKGGRYCSDFICVVDPGGQ